jgi:DNA processing protein
MTGPAVTGSGVGGSGVGGCDGIMTGSGVGGSGLGGSGLDARAYAAALATLPGIGPAGLADLLRRFDPEAAWGRVLEGLVRRPERPTGTDGKGSRQSWEAAAATADVAGRWEAFADAGIGVTYLGRSDYPAALRDDPQPPGVLFWRGELAVLERVCVAIVGTRRCTSYGLEVARRLARDLARAGCGVVSGLALGIDGAAHAGALEALGATTAGVAASGVDVVYPPRHAQLWADVVARGVVVSETPPGQAAQAWRFPARNRILAGLSRAVLVVESHAQGGSMHTVDAAAERGIDVLAVPGPVTSPASAGTNQLLRDGRPPVRDFRDVLDELGDFRSLDAGQSPSPHTAPPAVRLDRKARQVMAAIEWTPTATATIAERAALPLGLLSTTLVKLEDLGLIRGEGGWWERARC